MAEESRERNIHDEGAALVPGIVIDELRIVVERDEPQIELVQRAADVLGSERVAAWMQEPIPSLGGRTPYSLMSSEEGRKQVDAVLGRIEHGIY